MAASPLLLERVAAQKRAAVPTPPYAAHWTQHDASGEAAGSDPSSWQQNLQDARPDLGFPLQAGDFQAGKVKGAAEHRSDGQFLQAQAAQQGKASRPPFACSSGDSINSTANALRAQRQQREAQLQQAARDVRQGPYRFEKARGDFHATATGGVHSVLPGGRESSASGSFARGPGVAERLYPLTSTWHGVSVGGRTSSRPPHTHQAEFHSSSPIESGDGTAAAIFATTPAATSSAASPTVPSYTQPERGGQDHFAGGMGLNAVAPVSVHSQVRAPLAHVAVQAPPARAAANPRQRSAPASTTTTSCMCWTAT